MFLLKSLKYCFLIGIFVECTKIYIHHNYWNNVSLNDCYVDNISLFFFVLLTSHNYISKPNHLNDFLSHSTYNSLFDGKSFKNRGLFSPFTLAWFWLILTSFFSNFMPIIASEILLAWCSDIVLPFKVSDIFCLYSFDNDFPIKCFCSRLPMELYLMG